MGPEDKARLEIDKKLKESGWIIQDLKDFNPIASSGVAVREFPTSSGPCDYALFIDRQIIGVIEAKKGESGFNIIKVHEQTERYGNSKFNYVDESNIRFLYEATDIIISFSDLNDIDYRPRQVFSFHRPETLEKFLADKNTLRNRLKDMPGLDEEGFRWCQIKAINNLEESLSLNKPRALIQMATGAGKTYTAVNQAYRLLKFGKAQRILFLVDTRNLGKQAEAEFRGFRPNDDTRLFPELYNVYRLNSSYIPNDAQICISTIQRMYSILRGTELDESLEEESPYEYNLGDAPKEVVYNKKYPPEYFDFIIIDECHRSIYNVWQQVLDYFDAFLIGLTATPDKRTFGFFNQNVVSEYPREQAIIDGVNVPEDIYTIETDITKNGAAILKQTVEIRDRLTREKRWEQLDEEVSYSSIDLDKSIVNPSQIRTIIKTIKEKMLTEIFPGRKEVPKTLIFAKTDSHANDIIKIVLEEFGEGVEFCRKITYKADDPEGSLSAFRNNYYPRIAVTVSMIATGTDVKPIECLIFMRDVKSKNRYEQMVGRGTRTLSKEDLQDVSPSAISNKTHFVIIDAVGVTKSIKTETRPLERKPTVSFKDLLMRAATGTRNEDNLTSLANRLIRLNNEMNDSEREKISEFTGGISINDLSQNLLDSYDKDIIDEKSKEKLKKEDISEEERQEIKDGLIDDSTKPFANAELREYLLKVKSKHDQIIDKDNIDYVIYAGWDRDAKNYAEETIESFHTFIEKNKDEITALQIIYNQNYKSRQLTLDMVNELYEKMQEYNHFLTIENLWSQYEKLESKKVKGINEVKKLSDLVSLIRFALKQEGELNTFELKVQKNFKDWIFSKNAGYVQFTEEQTEWLRMIRDHIGTSLTIEKEDLELSPFDEHGGLGKFFQLFGNEYLEILDEMNKELVA